jgi:ATP-dependent Clp protease adaptor protein ClpS
MELQKYRVVLLNDDSHSYAYVVTMLNQVFGFPHETAFELAKEVDSAGRVIIYTGPKEHAEFKLEQVMAFGPDPSIPHCQDSMGCELEPA